MRGGKEGRREEEERGSETSVSRVPWVRDDSALTRVAAVTVVVSHEHTKVWVNRTLG